jgi:hypothetical protein
MHCLDLLSLHLETDHFQWIWIGGYHVGSPSGKYKLLPGGHGMQVGTSKVLWIISFYSNCSNWFMKQTLIFAFLCVGMIFNNPTCWESIVWIDWNWGFHASQPARCSKIMTNLVWQELTSNGAPLGSARSIMGWCEKLQSMARVLSK